jgi:integrase
VKKRLIPYNPARDADLPRYSTDEREYLTLALEDVAAFFDAAAGDRFEALFVVAILSGPRPAEIRALKWADLILPELPGVSGEARIRRTVTELEGRGPVLRNTTKTGKPRPVHLFPEVVAALRAHRTRYLEERVMHARAWAELWSEHPDLVFPSIAGGVMLRSNLSHRHFKPILKAAGLPAGVRLYDLRHTFATLWVESGEDLKVLQEILGHSRYETTANRYVHPSPRAQREAMARFGERFRRPG